MRMYYISGLPYSENELYHHGIKGQKWGIRNFQNPDGSLTALGRVHYGIGSALQRAGNRMTRQYSRRPQPEEKKERPPKKDGFVKTYAKRAGSAMVRHFKSKHPWMMSNEEIAVYNARMAMERQYLSAIADRRKALKGSSFVRNLLEKEATKFADTFTDTTARKVTDKLFDSGSMSSLFKESVEMEDWMNLSTAELKDRAERAEALRQIEGKGGGGKKGGNRK